MQESFKRLQILAVALFSRGKKNIFKVLEDRGICHRGRSPCWPPLDGTKDDVSANQTDLSLTLFVKLGAEARCSPLLFAQTLSIPRPP